MIPEDRIRLEIGKGGSLLVPALVGEQAERKHGEALRDTHLALYLDGIKEQGVRAFPRVNDLFDALGTDGVLEITLVRGADELKVTVPA